MEDYAGFELQIGEITALRTFRIGPDGQLYPLYSDLAWIDGLNTACCRVPPRTSDDADGRPPHTAPAPDCTCGYYAYGSEAAAAGSAHTKHVLAVVALWGNVIAGTRGVRAEHAHIDVLWMSDAVPRELATSVAARYPSTSIYADKSTMLAEHPPTPLDCYEIEAPQTSSRKAWALRAAICTALIIGSPPASWIWHHNDARLIWGAEVCFFVVAVLLRRTGKDVRARGATLFYAAITLWLLAPFAGAAGTLLLRLPILQIAALGLIQRIHLNREARRFPAQIGSRRN